MRLPVLVASLSLLFMASAALFPQEGGGPDGSGAPSAVSGAREAESPGISDSGKPSAPAGYGLLMLGEFFLPGSAHIAMGDAAEGVLELSISLPLIGLGQALIWYHYLAPRDGEVSPLLRNAYPYGQEEWFQSRRWALELGLALDGAGRAVAAYSAWTAHREYLERYGASEARGSLSPLDVIAAPFLPRNALSAEVLPVAALVGLCSFPAGGFDSAAEFFSADSQPFWGREYPPAAAFALKAATSLVFSLFSAAARELAFRGLVLERDGLIASVSFSASYSLLSMSLPGASPGELALRAGSEAAYSWYAGSLAKGKGGLGKAIALRYWCEAGSSVIGYVTDPRALPPLCAGISVRF